jgi:proteasome lid subunit RPN8/RPN11
MMSANSAHFGTDFKATRTSVVVSSEILSEIEAHASDTYPEECCGLLLGKFEKDSKLKVADRSKRMENVFLKEERFHRYTIDPKEFLTAESEAEKTGLEIVGIYHSHPNAPAKPSEFDTKHAWPTLSYVVVSVRDSRPEQMRSWVLKDDRSEFEPEELMEIKK